MRSYFESKEYKDAVKHSTITGKYSLDWTGAIPHVERFILSPDTNYADFKSLLKDSLNKDLMNKEDEK
jgi:hypothetical protein